MDTTSIVLVGVGGQGILLAAKIVSATAVIAGHDVKTNEVHGMAQRGGSVIAQIRYGKKVYTPLVIEESAAVLGSLEQIEALRYAHLLKKGGLAVVSKQAIIPVTVSSGPAEYPSNVEERLNSVFSDLHYIDAPAVAAELGNSKAANTVLLGTLSKGVDLPVEAWHQAIKESVKPQFVDINIAAFNLGREN